MAVDYDLTETSVECKFSDGGNCKSFDRIASMHDPVGQAAFNLWLAISKYLQPGVRRKCVRGTFLHVRGEMKS